MNVLPSSTRDDMVKLVQLVAELGDMDCQLTMSKPHATNAIWGDNEDVSTKKIVLSTFGGGEASFGGESWQGFLRECKDRGLNVRSQQRKCAFLSPKTAPLLDRYTSYPPSSSRLRPSSICRLWMLHSTGMGDGKHDVLCNVSPLSETLCFHGPGRKVMIQLAQRAIRCSSKM